MQPKEIKIYKTKDGKEPFRDWFLDLGKSQKAIVQARLKRVQFGNYGLYKILPGGLSELKFTNGLRIYFAELDKILILLLSGGNKSKQSNDIKKAQGFLNDYITRSKNNE